MRGCSDADLAHLVQDWSVPGGVHEAHHARQASGTVLYLVAWEDGAALGAGVLRLGGYLGLNGAAAHPGAMEICPLQVRPEHRGRSAGTALVAAADQRARARGARLVALGVGEDNLEARRLYTRLGYRRTGIVDVTEYDWTDEAGTVHHARESDEMLLTELPPAGS